MVPPPPHGMIKQEVDDYSDVVSYVNFHGGFVESGRSHGCIFSAEAKHERPVQ